MPSDYAKWLQRNEQPEQPNPMTRQERVRNWIDYHWKPVLAILVLVACVVSLVLYTLGVGRTVADYQIAYLGSYALSDEAEAALVSAVAAVGEDLNGDGQVLVTVNQYTGAPGSFQTPTEESMGIDTASSPTVQLMADIQAENSSLFLMEDAEAFQEYTALLSDAEGNQPSEGDVSTEGRAYSLTELTALSALAEHEELAGLSIGRRYYFSESDASAACDALWSALLACGVQEGD